MKLKLNDFDQGLKINLVTGGAGFLGSHLIDSLMESGEKVICIDNFFNGNLDNIQKWTEHKNFECINMDVCNQFSSKVDRIWHLASIASPDLYLRNPIETLNISFVGSYNMLELARKFKAKILLTSSSEIYGESNFNILNEEYLGNINCFSERASYAEAKRISETLFFNYKNIYGVDIRIARIFNTYGPRLSFRDGRVISKFIYQIINDMPVQINGDGNQTRSFCYVDDMIKGLRMLMESEYSKPINLGSKEEISIKDLAYFIGKKIGKNIKFQYCSSLNGDTIRRKPQIDKAYNKLGWLPSITLDKGLELLINDIVKNK